MTAPASDSYTTHVREFRHLLLTKQTTSDKCSGARLALKKIFTEIDENGDGVLTDQELYQFMISLGMPVEVRVVVLHRAILNLSPN